MTSFTVKSIFGRWSFFSQIHNLGNATSCSTLTYLWFYKQYVVNRNKKKGFSSILVTLRSEYLSTCPTPIFCAKHVSRQYKSCLFYYWDVSTQVLAPPFFYLVKHSRQTKFHSFIYLFVFLFYLFILFYLLLFILFIYFLISFFNQK